MKPDNFLKTAGKSLFIVLFVFSFSCSKDDDPAPTITPPPTNVPPACANCQLLYYGGSQVDAPTLEGGSYQAAARYTAAKIGNLVGRTIKEIHYFIVDKPDSIKVKLYGPLDDKGPGNLLYAADVTDSAERGKWNIHTLKQAVTLKNEDMWLGVDFKFTGPRRTVGCDPGPALPDGDWLYSTQDGFWTPFSKRTSTSIYWTIRLNVAL